jgi:aminoglycoside phosphotransferase family enzyme/predicted kinase
MPTAIHPSFDQSEVISFLADPATYGESSVVRYETHGSIVFLAGDRAYKLKRAVRYPYMDFSSVARRRAMCERELAVNRRTAPMLYLECRPIVRTGDGTLRFGAAEKPRGAIDWVVVMRRFDQDSLLENMRRSGQLDLALMRRVADSIAAFHGAAEVTKASGGAAGILAVIVENEAALGEISGDIFDPERVAAYGRKARAFHQRVCPVLEARRQGGFVRRCHGDLHLNNICVLDGSPLLFDAIEFNDEFSCIDVLYDIAFLLMDLHRHGLAGHANTVFNRYLQLTGDYKGLAALPLFLSCRAAVRSHVAVSAATATKDRSRLEEAGGLLQHAIDYLGPPPPRLLAVGGVSGTGKTTLANAVAPLFGPCPGAVVIRSDVIRKQLMGVEETTRLAETAYTAEITRRVYDRLAEIATCVLAAGYSAIADAVFGRPQEQAQIRAAADAAGVRFDGLWLEGPGAVLSDRIARRRDDASDATAQVLQAQLRSVARPADWQKLDAALPRKEAVQQATRAMGFALPLEA